jgi:hypothetical protein
MHRCRLVVLAAWVGALPVLGGPVVGCSGDSGAAPSAVSGDASFFEAGIDASRAPDAEAAGTDASDATIQNNEHGSPDATFDSGGDEVADLTDGAVDEGAPASTDAGPPADGGDVDGGGLTPTDQILDNIAPDCLSCALANDLLDPTGIGSNCEQAFDAPASAANCLATLTCMLSSGCGATGDTTPCLCGALDVDTCNADDGGTPLYGPCTSDYYSGYGTTDVTQFEDRLGDTTTSPGSASNLVGLLSSFGCDACF